MIYINVDFYNEFQCIADACPNTCCAGWDIDIDLNAYQKMIDNQDKLPIPAKDWLIEQDETVMVILDHQRCPMLNEKNLCHVVLRLGTEYLPYVCSTYPRAVAQYGGIVESYLTLSCPGVITRLAGQNHIKFCSREDETPLPEYEYTQLYLFESSVRFSIISIIQNIPEVSLSTRLFASFNILEKAINEYLENQLDFNILKADVDFYAQKESLSALDTTLKNIVNEKSRYTFLQQLQTITGHYTVFEHFAELAEKARDYFGQNDFSGYLSDLEAFRHYIKSYDIFYSNYWAYHIFSDTIVIPDYNLAKEGFIYAAAEFCLIQSLALAVYAEKKELDHEEYIYIISCVSRRMEHDSDYKKDIINSLKKNNSISVATLLLMILV